MRKEKRVRLKTMLKAAGRCCNHWPEGRQAELMVTIHTSNPQGIIRSFKVLKEHLYWLIGKLLLDNRVLSNGAEQLQYAACVFQGSDI